MIFKNIFIYSPLYILGVLTVKLPSLIGLYGKSGAENTPAIKM